MCAHLSQLFLALRTNHLQLFATIVPRETMLISIGCWQLSAGRQGLQNHGSVAHGARRTRVQEEQNKLRGRQDRKLSVCQVLAWTVSLSLRLTWLAGSANGLVQANAVARAARALVIRQSWSEGGEGRGRSGPLLATKHNHYRERNRPPSSYFR